mgnify:CR=1 FL=1
MPHKTAGFTLIEMLVVLAIIAILAMMAIPSTAPLKMRAQVAEIIQYVEPFKSNIESLYMANEFEFPETNKLAGLPDADKLISNQISSVELRDGAFHIQLGNSVYPALQGKTISIQPLVVTDSPSSPIDWLCGLADEPKGMQAAGANRTNIANSLLPNSCRGKVKD